MGHQKHSSTDSKTLHDDDEYHSDSEENSDSQDLEVPSQAHVKETLYEISTNQLLKTLKRKLSKNVDSDDENKKKKRCDKVQLDNDNVIKQALFEIHMDQVVNNLKQKLNIPSNIGDFKLKGKPRNNEIKSDSFTRFSVKYFSEVLASLTPHHKAIISNSCFRTMLHFDHCFVPNRFAIWIANQVDINSSDIIVRDKVIPLNKESVHIVLGLPLGGTSINSNSDVGKRKILDSFRITSIPSVKFFGGKLISKEELSDEQILICFMMVSLNCFLCPNSSLIPSTKYLSAFEDMNCIDQLDWCKLVYDCLMMNISKLDKSKTFGGCIFYLVVHYLDFLNFGLRRISPAIPRIKVWKNTMIKDHAKFDKISHGIYGRRPVKDISSTCYETIEIENDYVNVEENKTQCSFVEMLKTSVGDMLPLAIQEKICELLYHHFGKEEDMTDNRPKKLLIDVMLLLANCSTNYPTQPNDEQISVDPVKQDNNNVEQAEEDNENFNSSPIGNSTRIFDDDKHVQTDTNHNSSEKIAQVAVDDIMKKLYKEGQAPLTRPSSIQTKQTPATTGDDKPKFKIWDSDDDLHNETTPTHDIIPDSYSPNPCYHPVKKKITPRKLSQILNENVEIPIIWSDSEDKLYMETLPNTISPFATLNENKENEKFSNHNSKDSPDVIIIGEKKFSKKCADAGNKTNILYNKMNRILLQTQKNSNTSNASPKRVMLCNIRNLDASTSSTKQINHGLRRVINPAKYCTDPYTPQRSSFTVSQYERQIYTAVCYLSSTKYQDQVAVDIDGVHCKFRSFGGSFKSGSEMSNFVVSVFCRYLFHLSHPSKSKRHYFFSSIGDDLLKHPSKTDFKSVQKCFHGASYARPVQSCEMLFFPILYKHHWFVFIVHLKDQLFVFLDSLNEEGSPYQEEVKIRLTSNFALAWNSIMTDYAMNFDDFQIIYPPVPHQNNIVDCGIFTMKFMEVWAPRVQLTNHFSQKDIANIRIQYVNRLFFHPNNSMLNTNIKKLVTECYVQG